MPLRATVVKKSRQAKKRRANARASASGAPRPRAKKASSGVKLPSGLGASIGAAIGTALAGAPGTALGSVLGGGAQSLLKSVTGFGDYEVAYNTILKPDQVPQFKGGKTVVITHREYVQDIISSSVASAFKIETFMVNPANAQLFPWLQSIAQNFESYRIHGMVFEFKSMSANALNSVNTNLGSLIMSSQMNVLSPDFTNKQAMENYEFGVSCKPSESLMCALECDPKLSTFGPWFNNRIDGNVANGDSRLYDMAKFSIATNGLQGTSVNVGELWVTYQLEFQTPRLSSPDFTIHWQLGGDAGTVTTAAPLSNPVLTSTSDDLEGFVLTNTTITIPKWFSGNIEVAYFVAGTVAAACVDPAMTPSIGASDLNILNLDTENERTSTYAAGTVAFETSAYFKIVSGGLITFSGGTFPTGTVIGDLIIISMSNSLAN